MKISRSVLIFNVTTSIFLVIINCCYGEPLSTADKQIFEQHLVLCKKQSELSPLIDKYVYNSVALVSKCISVVDHIKSGNSSKINSDLKELKRKLNRSVAALSYYEKSYKTLKQQYDKIIIDKDKIAELDKLEQVRADLQARINRLKFSFEVKRYKLFKGIDIREKNQRLKKLFEKYFLIIPKNKSAIVNIKKISPYYTNASVSCMWRRYNMHIASADVRLRVKPIKLNSDKIANRYTVSSLRNDYIKLWVGNFEIKFWVRDKSLRSKKKMKYLVMNFIDIPGLEKVSKNELIQDSIILYNKNDKIEKSLKQATSKLKKKLSKTNQAIADLNKFGYKSSNSLAQTKIYVDNAKKIAFFHKRIITTSELLIKLLESSSNNYKVNITAIENKITELKNEMILACKAAKQVKNNLIKELDFNLLNKKYQILVNKFIRTPKSKEFVLINRISTSACLGISQITYTWSTGFSNEIKRRKQVIFTGKINYAPRSYSNHSPLFYYGMIDDKYFIYQFNRYSIEVQAGDFMVSLTSKVDSFYKEQQLKKAVKELYDLDAIASALK